jgi:DNA mismatch repair protein MSH3
VDERCGGKMQAVVEVLATLDSLLALASIASRPGWVRPTYVEAEDEDAGKNEGSLRISIRDARHPVLDHVFTSSSAPTSLSSSPGPASGVVPNDVDLGVGLESPGSCLVVTGPNMGGKSTYIRTVALCQLLGQLGSFLPATSASLPILAGIYTRMGSNDDLARGLSTFMVELWNAGFILRKVQATGKEGGCRGRRQNLVILDELGRGTATYDGMAIAEATLKYLARRVGCPVLFVTHYPQLGEVFMADGMEGGREEGLWVKEDGTWKPKVKAGHMAFLEGEEGEEEGEGGKKMTFLYKLKEGGAARSYGLNVARMAGMDEGLLSMARRKSRELEAKFEVMMEGGKEEEMPVDKGGQVEGGRAAEEQEEEGGAGREKEEEEKDDAEEGEEEEGMYRQLEVAVGELGALEESGVSQREYVRRQRAVLTSLIALQEKARAMEGRRNERAGRGGGT